ncbi:DUF1493 family protein [Luteolibacter luteus]|uniref:DUF1493 family protein n=1 Tax=Luteolibacter luteus TaxID=2728835 RepID=A0A858RQP2_9BACT|nr:DUF1493 family protein [Luteolibacter luteus]QJE98961.1 DUF1493 family protein [Luteolibacter luteus]
MKLSEVTRFVAGEIGCDPSKLTPATRLLEDLGIDGDDAAELMESFAFRFAVDLTGYDHRRHFGPEAGWSPVVIHPSAPLIPITIIRLAEAAETGHWVT